MRLEAGVFPLTEDLRVAVTYGVKPVEPEGYDTITAIEEVLVDVGVIADERLVQREKMMVDPTLGDSDIVTIEPE